MSSVLFNEFPTVDGKQIVEVVLNAERTLNALSLEMIERIQGALNAWQHDERVAAILIDSVGDKAFCAGGDVVSLCKKLRETSDTDFGERYFAEEYKLDYTLHTYSKPIICWASGIVMGGGMGLMNGCSHRIVTESSKLSMPEAAIGLYPDVGASWFLNRMPGRSGLFVGLTGSALNAADALFVGLADRFVQSSLRHVLMERLQDASWGSDAYAVVNKVLRDLEEDSAAGFEPYSNIKHHLGLIQSVTDHDVIEEVINDLLALETDDPWLTRAKDAVSTGSPLSHKLINAQLNRTKHMSLKEVFISELALSVQCCMHREFPEGVRALLIDKDRQPHWTYPTIDVVPDSAISAFFVSPWLESPLAHM